MTEPDDHLAQARELLAAGEYQRAIDLLEGRVSGADADPEAVGLLCDTLLAAAAAVPQAWLGERRVVTSHMEIEAMGRLLASARSIAPDDWRRAAVEAALRDLDYQRKRRFWPGFPVGHLVLAILLFILAAGYISTQPEAAAEIGPIALVLLAAPFVWIPLAILLKRKPGWRINVIESRRQGGAPVGPALSAPMQTGPATSGTVAGPASTGAVPAQLTADAEPAATPRQPHGRTGGVLALVGTGLFAVGTFLPWRPLLFNSGADFWDYSAVASEDSAPQTQAAVALIALAAMWIAYLTQQSAATRRTIALAGLLGVLLLCSTFGTALNLINGSPPDELLGSGTQTGPLIAGIGLAVVFIGNLVAIGESSRHRK
jgi:hypothetical protein